jgi:uncharacterized membrane protein
VLAKPNEWETPVRFNENQYRGRIWFLAAVCWMLYAMILYWHYITFEIGDDFGLFMQSVNDPSGLLRNVIEGSHYSNHFSPIYELFSPLTRWTSSVFPLLAIQALAGVLVAPGLFEIGIKVLPTRLAFTVACVAFIYPPLVALVSGDPYENVFAPAVTIWLIATVYDRRWFVAACLTLFALMIKEDQAVFLSASSLIVLSAAVKCPDQELTRFAVFVLFASAATLAVYLFVVRPSIVGQAGAWAALDNAVRRPTGQFGEGISAPDRAYYFLAIVLPLAMLPLAAPRWFLLLLLAPLGELLLARNPTVWAIGTHYGGVWIGYALVAAVLGLANVYRKAPIVARYLGPVVLIVSAFSLIISDPARLEHGLDRTMAHGRALARILATRLPPPGTTMGTHDELFGHLWNYPGIEYGVEGTPCYALIDSDKHASKVVRSVLRRMDEGEYVPIWSDSGVVLLLRIHPRCRAIRQS